MTMNKENKYIVFKRDDALKYLTEVEMQSLEHILLIIEQGRESEGKKSINNYYVCNVDEPYAQIVYGVIIGGEATKDLAEENRMSMIKSHERKNRKAII